MPRLALEAISHGRARLLAQAPLLAGAAVDGIMYHFRPSVSFLLRRPGRCVQIPPAVPVHCTVPNASFDLVLGEERP